jgi:hypothetical protein
MRTTGILSDRGVAGDLAFFQNAEHIRRAVSHVHRVRFRQDELSGEVVEGRRRDFRIAGRRFEPGLQAPQAYTLPSSAELCSSTLRRPSGLKGRL